MAETPLWPAGHLPPQGGETERRAARFFEARRSGLSQFARIQNGSARRQVPLWAAPTPPQGGETRPWAARFPSAPNDPERSLDEKSRRGASGCPTVSPPLWGRWPAGQRGSLVQHPPAPPSTTEAAPHAPFQHPSPHAHPRPRIAPQANPRRRGVWRLCATCVHAAPLSPRDADGPYIADFAWLTARIIVECDGDTHETAGGRRHDGRRDAFLRAQGFTVLRFDNAQVIDNPDYVAVVLAERLEPFLADDGGAA